MSFNLIYLPLGLLVKTFDIWEGQTGELNCVLAIFELCLAQIIWSILFLLFLHDEKNPNINIFLLQDIYGIGVLEQVFYFCVFIPADTRSTSIIPVISF